jgi:predicted acyl esterase
MRVVTTWIPMSDGVRLAATLYMPDRLESGERLPPLLEYLPYRKDDAMVERDYDLYSYMVPRGYVGARVDMRGTGASEGVLPADEYTEREHLDGEEVIAWLAAQPWSNGNVGMWGISWGGFNAIQMAMRRPPELKAIVALMATDERFEDDIHYIDGILHVDEWVLMMDLLNALSPPPDFPLDEETFAARFDRPPWMFRWVREQRDGPYWRRGSLRPHYGAIAIPALLIGGWFDGYRDSVPRMVQHLTGPVKGMVGPWNHSFPHAAVPGPSIEWRAEAVRWWDRWLKGVDTGIDREPPFAVYVRDRHAPDPALNEIPGRWRWLDGWPCSDLFESTMCLRADGILGGDPGPSAEHRLTSPPSSGVEAGFWWGEVTPDQRRLDDSGLSYETEPLEQDLVVVGMPRAELVASADTPLAHWFCRLCDVAHDGASTLVAGGGLNGAHRESPTRPHALVPGEWYRLTVEMRFTGWTFRRGHRIRLVVSNALWPMLWPAPYRGTTSLGVGGEHGSRLILPVLPAEWDDGPAFERPAGHVAPPGTHGSGDPFPAPWTVTRGDGASTVEWAGEYRTELPWSVQVARERMSYRVEDDHPETASVLGEAQTDIDLEDRRLTWRGVMEVSSDATHFRCRFRREVLENGSLVRERMWEERIPRDHQ